MINNLVLPRHSLKVRKNTLLVSEKKTGGVPLWSYWETYETALLNASEEQQKCWESFEYYRLYINNHKTFNHMRVWESALITKGNSRYLQGVAGADTLILAPRESAKSTYLAQWISWLFGMHLSPWCKVALKVLGVSYNIDTALPRSRQIQALIKSENYIKIFPWIRPSSTKFGEKEWMLDLEYAGLSNTEEQYSYVCAGLTGAINSRRCHLVMLDDLIKSPESIRNNAIREAMISNWENVIQYTRYDGSRAICLGTRMSANDIYCTTFTDVNGWDVIEQSALLKDENGVEYSFWEPENDKAPGMPLSRLLLERERTPISFIFQRQNKIVRAETQSINPKLIIKESIPYKIESLVLGIDLSAGIKENNDYTAMVLGGKSDNKFVIIDAVELRLMGNKSKLEAIIEIWDYWQYLLPQNKALINDSWVDKPAVPLRLWFDSSSYGLSFQGDFTDFIKDKKIVDWIIHPVPASGRGDKLTRLRRHSALFENKIIVFNKFSRTMPDGRRPMNNLIDQLMNFGSIDHDDLADAFELCVSGLRSFSSSLSVGNYE